MTGSGAPYRNRREFTRPHQMRGLTRSRTAGHSSNDMWMPMFGSNQWPGSFAGGNATPFNKIQELDESPLQRPAGFGGMYGSAFAREPKRRADYAREPVSFERAAHKLNEALRSASTACRDLNAQFEREILESTVAHWAPSKAIDALWTTRLEWDGAKPKSREKSSDEQRSASDAIIFGTVPRRLLAALEDVKMAGHPPVEYLEEAGPKFSPEMFRHVMNKLRATLRSIEELMESVKNDRRLMGLLIKDMAGSMELLAEVEGLWRPKEGRGEGGRWDGAEFAWPGYGEV